MLFDSIDSEARAEIARGARIKSFDRGQTLFRNSGRAHELYVILRGRLKIVSTGPRGNELILGITEPGDISGFVSVVDGGERFVNAIALRPGEAIAIGREPLMKVASRNPEALHDMIRILTAHLRAAAALAQTVGLLDARGRLLSGLLRLASRYGRSSTRPGAVWIEHGLSQEDLAATVGITRVMANRALRDWRDAGLVETGRGYVHMLDPDRLEAVVLRSE